MEILQVILSKASNLTKNEKYIICGSVCIVGVGLLDRVLSFLEKTMEREYSVDFHTGSFGFSLKKQ
ncbi:MAG: hypothetical protein RR946_09610 [Clostridia bacterium]